MSVVPPVHAAARVPLPQLRLLRARVRPPLPVAGQLHRRAQPLLLRLFHGGVWRGVTSVVLLYRVSVLGTGAVQLGHGEHAGRVSVAGGDGRGV